MTQPRLERLPNQLCFLLACTYEVLARKPGNVHRLRGFSDVGLHDFLVSAAAAAPLLEDVPRLGVGDLVLEGTRRTRQLVSTNTNLGILLLIAPLAAVPEMVPLESGVDAVLAALTLADSEAVFAAIRLARPGGLGRSQEQDVAAAPTLPLRQVMTLAAERDLIALQYANGFREVFAIGVPALQEGLQRGWPLEEAVVGCALRLMSAHPDSLITRKRGLEEARHASRWAAEIVASGWPETDRSQFALVEFDAWLRAESNGRNPGATADLVAASLFAALRDGTMHLPVAAGFCSNRILLH
jgi:triphosphoribosyl-dephospho-CoA synthase